jgi:hypothetical protein
LIETQGVSCHGFLSVPLWNARFGMLVGSANSPYSCPFNGQPSNPVQTISRARAHDDGSPSGLTGAACR